MYGAIVLLNRFLWCIFYCLLQNQVGFFEFIVLPFYETVSQVVFEKDFAAIHNIAKQNYNLWKESDRRQLSSIVAIKNEVFLNDHVQVT